MSQADDIFEEHRPALARLAYRMLGSLADADDVLQEAYLRWARRDQVTVKSPRAYLLSVVTRLCIDLRQSIDSRRITYVGPWLPEPVVESFGTDPGASIETVESVSLALMFILESLSPVERAAYLLRRIFDYDYEEISEVLEKSEPACRQIVSRAEQRIHEKRPRFVPDAEVAERVTESFMQACSTGDLDGLKRLLAADAVLYSDGGGKVHAALAPILGADRVARFFTGIIKKAPPDMQVHRVRVNGLPGLVTMIDGRLSDVLALDVVDGRIAGCFVIRNPDKLTRVTQV
jgi:RNA polymerase sigma-70 factor (ECF subfamily)